MKKLIIAEKPSMAISIAKALSRYGRFEKKDGYFESDKYVVSFCLGHLFTLSDIKDYDESKDKWSIDNLPFIPINFQWKLKNNPKTKKTDEGIKKQYNILKDLYLRNDIDTIIHSGDSDLEGQVIIQLVLDNIISETNIEKTIKRLWVKELTEDVIRYGMNNLKDISEYDDLFNEGILRHKIDWLLGINFTRYASIKAQTILRVGRVLVPTVKIIYDRDLEIENFKPVKYFQVESNEKTNDILIKLTLKEKYSNIEETKQIIENLNKEKAFVKNIALKEVKKYPSKLFSLSKLQSELSKKYKYGVKEVLNIVQSLYEKGLTTYPRTNTEYLSENEKEKVKDIIKKYNQEYFKDEILEFKDTKKIFDTSKIESHSAIIPTLKSINNKNLESLKEKELNVFNVIKNRFISNFLKEETLINETIMIIKLGENEFKLKGKSIYQEGYLKYEPQKIEGDILPNLNINDEINFLFKAVEKLTNPPRKIDTTLLLNSLKNPFKNNDDDLDDNYENIKKGIEIGTEATRAGIIENAKIIGYIEEKNSVYSITEKGKKFIELLNKLDLNLYKEKTVEMQKDLKNVFEKKVKSNVILDKISYYIYDRIENSKSIDIEKFVEKKEKEIIGLCPRCKKNIYESSKAFYCEGWKDQPKCEFFLLKENKFFISKGKKLTKTMVKNLLKKGETIVKGFEKKDGTGTYDCIITIEDTGKYINFKIKSFK